MTVRPTVTHLQQIPPHIEPAAPMPPAKNRRRRALPAVTLLTVAVVLTAFSGAAVTGAASAGAAVTAPALPGSMAALGDSISMAFNTHTDPATVPSPSDLTACPDGQGGVTGFPFDCPPNSWSTGTNPAINSVYLRLVAAKPALAGHQVNDAVSGVKVADLTRQAQQATSQGAQYVTVNIGVNDACTSTVAQETPLATFRTQFQSALSTLAASPAHPAIEVISMPNVPGMAAISQ